LAALRGDAAAVVQLSLSGAVHARAAAKSDAASLAATTRPLGYNDDDDVDVDADDDGYDEYDNYDDLYSDDSGDVDGPQYSNSLHRKKTRFPHLSSKTTLTPQSSAAAAVRDVLPPQSQRAGLRRRRKETGKTLVCFAADQLHTATAGALKLRDVALFIAKRHQQTLAERGGAARAAFPWPLAVGVLADSATPAQRALALAVDGTDVVLCTDANVRGLDIPELRHVISVGAPGAVEYTHRSGRVGRHGAPRNSENLVITLLAPSPQSSAKTHNDDGGDNDDGAVLGRTAAALGVHVYPAFANTGASTAPRRAAAAAAIKCASSSAWPPARFTLSQGAVPRLYSPQLAARAAIRVDKQVNADIKASGGTVRRNEPRYI
jgi:hypothetical protein